MARGARLLLLPCPIDAMVILAALVGLVGVRSGYQYLVVVLV